MIVASLLLINPLVWAGTEDYPCDVGSQIFHKGNAQEAILFWRKRADSTSMYYQYNEVLRCLIETNIVTENSEIIPLLKLKAKSGSSEAELMLAHIFLQNSLFDKDSIEEAVFWVIQAIEHGSVDAKALYAVMHTSSDAVKEDIKQAIILFEEAANSGSILAQASLAKTYKQGRYGIEKDLSKSKYWSLKAEETTHKLEWTSKKEHRDYRKSAGEKQ